MVLTISIPRGYSFQRLINAPRLAQIDPGC
jgi:hypothetical protein